MNKVKFCAVILLLLLGIGLIMKVAPKVENTSTHAREQLLGMSYAFILSRAIHVAAKMGIADALVGGPKSVEDLAVVIKADHESLYRLLKLLASYGIFTEESETVFAMTSLAEPLLSDHSDSIRALLMYHEGNEQRWQAYGHMEYSIKTGKAAYEDLFGQGYFDVLAKDPQKAVEFDEGMRNFSKPEDEAIADSFDFSGAKTITDLGGGKGGLLIEICKRYAEPKGIICDLEHVMPSAAENLELHKMQSRIELQVGSFFESVPAGADLYILKRILHDWSDQKSLEILNVCKQALSPTSRLLIMDAVVADGNVRDFAKDEDIAMLTLFGGKERTKSEWEALFKAVGLRLIKIHSTASMISILEVGILGTFA